MKPINPVFYDYSDEEELKAINGPETGDYDPDIAVVIPAEIARPETIKSVRGYTQTLEDLVHTLDTLSASLDTLQSSLRDLRDSLEQ